MRLIGDIARLNAVRFPGKTAIVLGRGTLTFHGLQASAQGIAALLAGAGVNRGDRIALLAENCLEFLPVYFGIVGLGAIAVPLNLRCAQAELEHMIRDSGSQVLFHTAALAETANRIAAALGGLHLVAMDETLLHRTAEAAVTTVTEDDPAVIMYTSGTTGLPKGVVLPHRALIEQAAGTALATGIRPGDRILITVPLFHGSGLYVAGHSHLYMGASLVLAQRFVASDQIDLIRDHAVTTFFGVPTQYGMLLDVIERPEQDLPSLRSGWYGGAPMPPDLLARAQRCWPAIRFQQLYGQTETTVTTVLAAEDHDAKRGTVGRELPNCEMRVVDADGRDCDTGVVGEVVVRRSAGMTGYFNNPEQTAATIRDGWIFTGDVGFLDADRFLTLVDRKRDVILSGGENVYPAEIEHVLLAHPAVLQAAVIGVADTKWGEVPLAFVVLRPGEDASGEALGAWCAERLARYKIPKDWRFADSLPHTANGKIRKPDLRELV